MKIIFMGGKNIGCGCLEYLLQYKKEVIAVFVNPDDTARSRWYRSATEIAQSYKVKVYESRSINNPNTMRLIKRLNPELIVVVYFDQILKRELINIPKYGCINLHLALAEEYRGCFPTTWAIINGEELTGVTLHYIDEYIDAGDIIAQTEVLITNDDTGKSLYDKCTRAGIKLFSETFPLIEKGIARRRKQVTTGKTRYYKREFPLREIDFANSGMEIRNYIRALTFPPFPPPYFYIGKKKMIVIEENEIKRYIKTAKK